MNAQKTFLGEYKWPIIFTFVVIILGTMALYVQGYFKNEGSRVNPVVFEEMRIKLIFDGEEPKFLAFIPSKRLSDYSTITGDPVPDSDSIVLGFQEARKVTDKNNVTTFDILWGYTLDNFFGNKVRVSGILKKTDPIIDILYILPEKKFSEISSGEKIYVRLTDEKMPKLFYYINSENPNWPKDIKFAQGGIEYFKIRSVEKIVININLGNMNVQVTENKTYIPMVLGSEEAKIMIEEKMFTNVGDKIQNFFDKNVVVVGILEQTNTTFDTLHYMPAL